MKVMRGVLFGVLFSVLSFWAPACWLIAQETTPEPPALTELQRLQVMNAAQAVELWQLKAQQAASEFEKAREALTKLVTSITPSGFVLNDQLQFVPKPPEASK